MDVDKEITKLEGKKEKLNGQLGKLREAIEVADYATKVQVCSSLFPFRTEFVSFCAL